MAENFLQTIEKYDSSEPIGYDYSSAEMEAAAKSIHSGNEVDAKAAKAAMPDKLKNLIKIVEATANKVNAKIGTKFKTFKNINFNDSNLSGKISFVDAQNSFSMSINVKTITRLPGLEVAAMVTKSLITAAAKVNDKTEQEIEQELQEPAVDEESKEAEDKLKRSKSLSKAKDFISAYLKDYLANIYADDFDKFGPIAEFVAKQIVADMETDDLVKIAEQFFDLEELDIGELAEAKVDQFLGKARDARISNIRNKAAQIALDPTKEIVALNYEQQAAALCECGPELSDKFEAINGETKVLTGKAVEEFCEFYVHNFLSSNNVSDIEVTFNARGALGTFHDGKRPRININLNKLQKMGSYTELAMTLSHELTHAVDSSKNKSEGNFNKRGGGLLNTISENISAYDGPEEGKELLVELKSYCYHINPNERHGRIGELSALMFMNKVGGKDPKIKQEMNASVAKYVAYQKKTVDMIQSLSTKLPEFSAKFQALVDSGKIQPGTKAYKLINDRIAYLSSNSQSISVEQELDSVKKAQEILAATEQRRQLEEARKQQEMQEELEEHSL